MNHVINHLNGKLVIERFGSQYIAFSNVKGSHINNVFPNFSVKYVYEGSLCYKIDSGSYLVSKDNLLYAASQPGDVYCENESDQQSIGLCIGLGDQLILEALRVHLNCNLHADPEGTTYDFSEFPQFLEGIYHRQTKKVSHLLYSATQLLQQGNNLKSVVSHEWFFYLAEMIISEEINTYLGFKNLKSSKLATKKELLRRLAKGKNYIDENFLNNPLISEVAKVALLSEYHFFRCFKLVYGISPYKYLVNKRLDFAKELIESNKLSLHQIGTMVGFSDQFSFSKAFKNRFKIAPSYFVNK